MSSTGLTSNKSLSQLVKLAERQGWEVTKTNGQHLRWQPPDGGTYVITSSTPGDENIISTIKRDLRNRGLTLDKNAAKLIGKALRSPGAEVRIEDIDNGGVAITVDTPVYTLTPDAPIKDWSDDQIIANLRDSLATEPQLAVPGTIYARLDSLSNRERKALCAMHRRADEHTLRHGDAWWPTECQTCGFVAEPDMPLNAGFVLALHLVNNPTHQPVPSEPDSEEAMKRDMTDPPARERLNCPFCTEWFWITQPEALDRHTRDEHGKAECPYCNKYFRVNKGGLDKHMRACPAGGERAAAAARVTAATPEPEPAKVIPFLATTGQPKRDDFNPDPCAADCGMPVGESSTSYCPQCEPIMAELAREEVAAKAAADALALVKEQEAKLVAVARQRHEEERLEREAAQRDEELAAQIKADKLAAAFPSADEIASVWATPPAEPSDDELFTLLELVLDGPVTLDRKTFAVVNEWMAATRKLLAIKYGAG